MESVTIVLLIQSGGGQVMSPLCSLTSCYLVVATIKIKAQLQQSVQVYRL